MLICAPICNIFITFKECKNLFTHFLEFCHLQDWNYLLYLFQKSKITIKRKITMNKNYTLEEVINSINLHFKDYAKSDMIELAKKQFTKLSNEDWQNWVNDFIP